MTDQNQDSKPATDAELMQTNVMLSKQVSKLEAQLKLATDALVKVNDQKKAQDAAEKQDLIDHIVADSKGKFTADALKDLDIRELKAMKIMSDTLESTKDEMFASVAALQAERDGKKLQGIDYYDAKTHEWRVK